MRWLLNYPSKKIHLRFEVIMEPGENYNKSKKENPEVKQCPPEKVGYIKDALEHFKLI